MFFFMGISGIRTIKQVFHVGVHSVADLPKIILAMLNEFCSFKHM